jgi:tRNA-Thr(GGU) m(6)t(6)A37 methyltransferase TsaA
MHLTGKAGKPIRIRVIGTIRTPFLKAAGTPIQPTYGRDIEARVLIKSSFAPALEDIEGFERLWLVYWMDRTNRFKTKVMPYRDNKEHGLFATRSPSRPNPIGMSVVRLLKREGSTLYVTDIDILDGTQLIDIKPYIPEFDAHPGSRAGWFDTPGVDRHQADGRFHTASENIQDAAESAQTQSSRKRHLGRRRNAEGSSREA